MKPISEYHDYRRYMMDFYEERKRTSAFTWRAFAELAGFVSPSYLKLVCDGKTCLSKPGVPKVAHAMGLTGFDLTYFTLLVRFGNAKTDSAKKEAFDEWQASYNENESFAYEYVLPKPKTVFDWHVAYILDKAMRDPYKSFGFWESHYLQSFGAAAREMRQFFQALRDRKDGGAFLEAALGRADLEPDDRRRVERVKADYSKIR